MVNATPCPNFTPKPWPLIHNPKKSSLISFSGTSNIGVSNNLDEDQTAFMVPSSENLHDSAVESEGPPPLTPAKKGKAKPVRKTTAVKVDVKKLGETADRKWRVVDTESDIANSDKEKVQESKPKRVKVKMQDEINVTATMKIPKNENEGNKYTKMVNSMVSSRKPASQPEAPLYPSQFQAVGGRQLKREGANTNIKESVGGKKLKREGVIANITKSNTFIPYSFTRAHPDNNIR